MRYHPASQFIGCITLIMVGWILLLSSCANRPIPQPPPAYILISIFYKTSGGVDLLNPSSQNSFKKKDLNVISKININGEVKEMQFNGNENGIDIGVDGTTSFNYFELAVPTNAGVTPIATYIRLSPSITDTVTYSFSSPKYPYFPDKIYYNKSLVWEIINTKPNGFWPSITIIK